jgi:hypothetical protein
MSLEKEVDIVVEDIVGNDVMRCSLGKPKVTGAIVKEPLGAKKDVTRLKLGSLDSNGITRIRE